MLDKEQIKYNMRAAERCIRIASYLGLPHVEELYKKYILRAQKALVRDFGYTFMSMHMTRYIRERLYEERLYRKVMPPNPLPDGYLVN